MKKGIKKENLNDPVTKRYLSKSLSEYPTKVDLKEALSNYPTKEDLKKELLNHPTKVEFEKFKKEMIIGTSSEMERLFGIYTEHIDDQFKLVIENIQMTHQRLDSHESRITVLESK